EAGSSVVQVEESMTLNDILVIICAKRGLPMAALKIAVVYRNKLEDSNIDQTAMFRSVTQFGDVDFIKVVSKDSGKYVNASQMDLGTSGANISAEVLVKDKAIEDVRAGIFQKAANAFSISNLTEASGTPKARLGGLFRKMVVSSGTDNKINDFKRSSSQGGSVGSLDVNASSEDSKMAPSVVDHTRSQGPDCMETRKSESFLNDTVEKVERDSNSPKPDFLAREGVALRKLSIRSNRSRANTGGIREINKRSSTEPQTITEDEKPDTRYANLTITLPNFRSISIRAPSELPMDAVLNYICENHKDVEFEGHTFCRNDGKEAVIEMDRPLGYLVEESKVEEVFIVPGEKVYRSTYFSEDGVDVLMLQTIQGKVQVMAGIPQKLVARLTDIEAKSDAAFIETFLLTFRYFMPADEFFRQLVSRYNCIAPENATTEEFSYFLEMRTPIQE
ncbi:hypothetical protein HDU98_004977, partial [Podochytrium sp. JEL0797]